MSCIKVREPTTSLLHFPISQNAFVYNGQGLRDTGSEGNHQNSGGYRTRLRGILEGYNAAGGDAKPCVGDRLAGRQAPEAVSEHVQQLQEAALGLTPRLLSAQ